MDPKRLESAFAVAQLTSHNSNGGRSEGQQHIHITFLIRYCEFEGKNKPKNLLVKEALFVLC